MSTTGRPERTATHSTRPRPARWTDQRDSGYMAGNIWSVLDQLRRALGG